jgi:hypothetical protein
LAVRKSTASPRNALRVGGHAGTGVVAPPPPDFDESSLIGLGSAVAHDNAGLIQATKERTVRETRVERV